MALQKRKRSVNWMASEKSLVVELVAKHFAIVENKKTDGTTMRQKIEEWKLIADEFNAQTTLSHRLAENLKAQWESMKKAAKKEAANARLEILKTGGGAAVPKKEDPCLKRILSLISTSAVGLFNPNDSDSILPAVPIQEEHDNYVEAGRITMAQPMDLPQSPIINYGEISVPSPNSDDDADDVTKTKRDPLKQEFVIADWGDYTPQLLKTPVSTPLKPANKNYKSGISRRRPSHTPASTSLELLHKEKIKAIHLQKDLAAKEADINKVISELDIEMKKEILKQEKIKTELLLLELRKKKKECKENKEISEEEDE